MMRTRNVLGYIKIPISDQNKINYYNENVIIIKHIKIIVLSCQTRGYLS